MTQFVDTKIGKVPAELAACAAGKDAYMQKILVPCLGCGKMGTCLHHYQGTDLPGHCMECAADYYCPHGTHPDDHCEECLSDKIAEVEIALHESQE